ncbi:MAG: hypothetical protein RL230_2811, partial [Pseudomonadota bacterium]
NQEKHWDQLAKIIALELVHGSVSCAGEATIVSLPVAPNTVPRNLEAIIFTSSFAGSVC